MKKNSILLQISILALLFSCFNSYAVSTREIERVRDKSVLDERDLQTIDNFIQIAVEELINTEDFTEIARIRSQITGNQSSQTQYRQQYSKSCKNYITEAFSKAEQKEGELRHKVSVNLMILVCELRDMELIDLALSAIGDEDKVIQYWAVRAVTNEKLVEYLLTSAAGSTIDKIANELSKSIDSLGPETIRLIADFVTVANSEAVEELVLKLADARIDQYEKYQAKPGIADMKILKLLCAKVLAKNQVSEFGGRFCQLYSYIFQRYINGLNDQGLEDERDVHMLGSILVEIEDKCIGLLTGFRQGVIRDAVKNKNSNAMEMEHSRLLGGLDSKGEIPSKYNLNYGKNTDGSVLTKPKVLPKKK
jgi:hypothetical protein